MKLKDRIFWTIITIGSIYLICVLFISVTPSGKKNTLSVGYKNARHAFLKYKKWLDNNGSYNILLKKLKSSDRAEQKTNKPASIAPKLHPVVYPRQNVKNGTVEVKDRIHGVDNFPKRRPQAAVEQKPPTSHISLLKVHMAGAAPLQNMFFRYGYEKNLSFIIPKTGHYFTKSTNKYEPIFPPKYGHHYDIVCYHACFNFTLFSSLLPEDTVYIAIVRKPYDQFVQSFYYYSRFFSFGYLLKIPEPRIDNIIAYPEKYEESCLSYTMNAMARDFGFQNNHFYDTSMESAKRYLESIDSVFKIVLVFERFEESLILMKRLLNWPLRSILFMPEKIDTPDAPIKPYMFEKFKKRNRLDYLVYNYFLQKIEDKIREGGSQLAEETINFKLIQKTVQNWCLDVYFGKMTIPATKWSEEFDVTSADCALLEKSEFAFLDLFRGKK